MKNAGRLDDQEQDGQECQDRREGVEELYPTPMKDPADPAYPVSKHTDDLPARAVARRRPGISEHQCDQWFLSE